MSVLSLTANIEIGAIKLPVIESLNRHIDKINLHNVYIMCIFALLKKNNKMTTTIFKSEKKAKVYEIRSAKAQGIYSANELVRVVKTDDINQLIECNESNQFYNFTATEIKA